MKFFVLAVIVGVAVGQSHHGRLSQGQYQQQPQQQQQAAAAASSQQQQYKDLDSSAQVNDRHISTTTYVPILHWNKEQEHDGTYRTSYETGNNIIAEESGYIKTFGEGDDKVEGLVQQGSYSYTSPEGQLITVHYTADETGFHASGDHIPTPPPVSEEIQKGLDLIYAGIRQQEEAAAREATQKLQQPHNQQIDRREDEKKYRI